MKEFWNVLFATLAGIIIGLALHSAFLHTWTEDIFMILIYATSCILAGIGIASTWRH